MHHLPETASQRAQIRGAEDAFLLPEMAKVISATAEPPSPAPPPSTAMLMTLLLIRGKMYSLQTNSIMSLKLK